MVFNVHRKLTGELIVHRKSTGELKSTYYVPFFHLVWQFLAKLQWGTIPRSDGTQTEDGLRPYYKLYWGNIELKRDAQFMYYVTHHDMPRCTPVDLHVYAWSDARGIVTPVWASPRGTYPP